MAQEAFRSDREQVAGTVLAGRYRLGSRIGRGGTADVFAAQDELLSRAVAIKVFHSDGQELNEPRRIEAEIRTLAGLRHPGLVTVFDAGVLAGAAEDATPFLVMELIHGQTLRRRLADGPLSQAEVARFGAGLAATLAYVHAEGVVHRDVKPANILLDEDAAHDQGRYTAKLADFGIARLTDSTRLTMVGITIGTANYLSPEQATGAVVGPSSDVYSLGLVLLECLTGRLAYPGTGVEAALGRLHRQPTIPASLGSGWVTMLAAMTDRDPDVRPTASVAAQALARLADVAEAGRSLTDQPTAVTEIATRALNAPRPTMLLPAPRPAGRRVPGTRWLRMAAAAAALVAVLIVVLASSRHGGSSGNPAPAPSYPSVSGPTGAHLRQLEGTVG